MLPKINNSGSDFSVKTCSHCHQLLEGGEFAHSKNIFAVDDRSTVCNQCITQDLKDHDFNWEEVDRICRYLDIPFIPREWERIKEMNGEERCFAAYAKIFADECYRGINWDYYDSQFKKLQSAGMIEDELPLLRERKYDELRLKWGANYTEDELDYLEQLYHGMELTQNINSALQKDQATKLCKISLLIEAKIRAEDKDLDKTLSSYDKLVKIADFTPKNIKNATDFETVGELFHWLEKQGWRNHYYDGATRDVIDELIANIQSFSRNLYLSEAGMGQDIDERVAALRTLDEMEAKTEATYDIGSDMALDEYDNAGLYEEEFDPTGGE